MVKDANPTSPRGRRRLAGTQPDAGDLRTWVRYRIPAGLPTNGRSRTRRTDLATTHTGTSARLRRAETAHAPSRGGYQAGLVARRQRMIAFRSERDGAGLDVVPARAVPNARSPLSELSRSGRPMAHRFCSHRRISSRPRFYVIQAGSITAQPGARAIHGQRRRSPRLELVSGQPEGHAARPPQPAQLGSLRCRSLATPLFPMRQSGERNNARMLTFCQCPGWAGERRLFEWSSSGADIYVQCAHDLTMDLWRFGADPRTFKVQNSERLTAGTGQTLPLAVSPNNRRVAYTAQRCGFRLWAFPFDAATGRITGRGEPVTEPRYMPGSRISPPMAAASHFAAAARERRRTSCGRRTWTRERDGQSLSTIRAVESHIGLKMPDTWPTSGRAEHRTQTAKRSRSSSAARTARTSGLSPCRGCRTHGACLGSKSVGGRRRYPCARFLRRVSHRVGRDWPSCQGWSCIGVEPDFAPVGARVFSPDRRWMSYVASKERSSAKNIIVQSSQRPPAPSVKTHGYHLADPAESAVEPRWSSLTGKILFHAADATSLLEPLGRALRQPSGKRALALPSRSRTSPIPSSRSLGASLRRRRYLAHALLLHDDGADR